MRIPKNKPIIGYKAFTKALQCREYQFEIGKEYHHKVLYSCVPEVSTSARQ